MKKKKTKKIEEKNTKIIQTKDRNSLLITCVFGVLLMLTMCYFGISGNAGLKATYSATTLTENICSCPDGYVMGPTGTIYEDQCVQVVGSDTCRIVKQSNTTISRENGDTGKLIVNFAFEESCTTLVNDYYTGYDWGNECAVTSTSISSNYMVCTRGTDTANCNIASSTGCSMYTSMGYTCTGAKIDNYTCNRYLVEYPDCKDTSCSYSYGSRSGMTIYINKTSGCSCPGSAWTEVSSTQCSQTINDGAVYEGFELGKIDYCPTDKGFTKSGSRCQKNTISYTIKYDLNDGTASSTYPTSAVGNETVTLSAPTKKVTITGNTLGTGATASAAISVNPTFAGWSFDSNAPDMAQYFVATGSSGIYYTFTEGTIKNSTKFMNLSSTSSGSVTMIANWTSTTVTLPTITKSGATCTWNTKSDGSGTPYASAAAYTVSNDTPSSITLYAICTSTAKSATIPTNSLCKSGLTYTGSAQQLTTATKGTGYTLSGYSKSNVGSHTITATLASGYVWSDGSTGTKTFTCSIAKATPTLSVSQPISVEVSKTNTSTYTYNGDGVVSCSVANTSIATCSVNTASKQVTLTGKANGTTTLTLSAAAGTNYNAKTATATVNVGSASSTTKTATIPTNSLCKSGLTYTGNAQQLTSVTSGTGYTLSGYSQTNAGIYTIAATLTTGYVWSDNSTGIKTFSCSISRGTPTLSVSSYTSVLTVGASQTLTYTYNGDGTVGCTSANTSVATCNVNNGKLTISSKTAGSTIVTLNASQGTNYTTTSKQVSVIVNSSGGNGDDEPTTNTYTATFNANGGVLSGVNTKSCSTDSTSCTITSLPTASKDGYTFKGWGTSSSCTAGNSNSLELTADKTYYACYVKNTSGGAPTNPDTGSGTDNDGNTTVNPETGGIMIALVWLVGIFAIGYAAWYMKKAKQN